MTNLYTAFGTWLYFIGAVLIALWRFLSLLYYDFANNPLYDNLVEIETTEDLDNIVPDEEINKIINK